MHIDLSTMPDVNNSQISTTDTDRNKKYRNPSNPSSSTGSGNKSKDKKCHTGKTSYLYLMME